MNEGKMEQEGEKLIADNKNLKETEIPSEEEVNEVIMNEVCKIIKVRKKSDGREYKVWRQSTAKRDNGAYKRYIDAKNNARGLEEINNRATV